MCVVLFEQNSSAGSRLIAATVSFFTKPENLIPKSPQKVLPKCAWERGFVLDTSLMIIRTIKVTCCKATSSPNLCLSSAFLLQCNRTPPQKKAPKKTHDSWIHRFFARDPPVAKRNLPWTRGLVLWRTRFERAWSSTSTKSRHYAKLMGGNLRVMHLPVWFQFKHDHCKPKP